MTLIDNLIHKQLNRKEMSQGYILYYVDIVRLSKYISTDIFAEECSLWKGYAVENDTKKTINFQLNNNRKSVQRILYVNYVDTKLKKKDILYNTCNNPLCCCLQHIKKMNK